SVNVMQQPPFQTSIDLLLSRPIRPIMITCHMLTFRIFSTCSCDLRFMEYIRVYSVPCWYLRTRNLWQTRCVMEGKRLHTNSLKRASAGSPLRCARYTHKN